MSEAALILQISPNDHPPFREICATYERAGESLGCAVRTVFLSAPYAQPLPGAAYLAADDLSRTGELAGALRDALQLDSVPVLALCHRYRSLRILLRSRLPVHRIVTIAHEFGLLRRWQRRLGRQLWAREVLFAGVSPAVQEDLELAVPGARCVPNALDHETFAAGLLDRQEALEQLGVPDTAFNVGVVGRLIPWKRPRLALAAWQALAPGPNARLLYLGDGEERAALAARATPNVHLAGFQPQARQLLKALDVLLVVSEDREAFGMVVLEAMAAGVPVLAGSAPGPRFVLGEQGFFYPAPTPAAIAEALADVRGALADGRAAAVAEAARERARQQFSVTALAARLDDLFFASP